MIASAGPYPSFLQNLATAGPIVQGIVLLLIVSFVWGAIFLVRRRSSSLVLILLVGAPTFFGAVLATLQSLIAEGVVRANEGGIVSWSRPDRYIGHVRLYLATGILMSMVLLCVHLLALRRESTIDRNA